MLSEKRVLAAGAANRGELGSGSFPLLDENETFDGTTHYDLIIVFGESPRPPVDGSIE